MQCPHCSKPMMIEFTYPVTGQILWRCKACGRTELTKNDTVEDDEESL